MDVMARGAGSKLADVLKRSGLAASVNDANRIARDISTTEDKVQEYFDQRKEEMYNDLAKRSFSHNVGAPKERELPKLEVAKHTHIHESTDFCPHCKRNYDDNPVLDISREKEAEKTQSIKEMFDEESSGQEFIYSIIGKDQPEIAKPQENIKNLNSFIDETIETNNETIFETVETIRNSSKSSDIETIKDSSKSSDIETMHSPQTEVQESKIEVVDETSSPKTDFGSGISEAKIEVIDEASSPKTDFGSGISEAKIEVIEEEPMDSQKFNENGITQIPNEIIPEEKKIETVEEQKIDLNKMFNFSSGKSMSEKMDNSSTPKKVEEKPIEKPGVEIKQSNGISTNSDSNHPKTGNSVSIDITEMFNFSKRGV